MKYSELTQHLQARAFSPRIQETDAFGAVRHAAWLNASGSRIVAVKCGDKRNPHQVQEVSAATTDALGWAKTAVGEKWTPDSTDGQDSLLNLLDSVR